MSTPETIIEEAATTEIEVKEEIKLPELGLHYDMPEADYHKSPGISKHLLDAIDKSPAHYIAAKNEPFEPTDDMIIGSAFHCLTLEPDKFDEKFVVNRQFKTFQSNAAKEWYLENTNAGKTVLKKETHYDNAMRMVEAIRNDPIASVLCDPDSGKAEVSGYWIDNNKSFWEQDGEDPTYRLCRCRADFINEAHHIAVDLKKAVNAGVSDFAKAMHSYRYDVQDTWYTWGLRNCGFRSKLFVFVVVEPVPPYAVGVYHMEKPEDRRQATIKMKRNLRRYHECMESGEWPAFPSGIRGIELPGYAKFNKFY